MHELCIGERRCGQQKALGQRHPLEVPWACHPLEVVDYAVKHRSHVLAHRLRRSEINSLQVRASPVKTARISAIPSMSENTVESNTVLPKANSLIICSNISICSNILESRPFLTNPDPLVL